MRRDVGLAVHRPQRHLGDRALRRVRVHHPLRGLRQRLRSSAVVDRKEARRMSRFQQFAMVAADEALRDAGLTRSTKSSRCAPGASSAPGSAASARWKRPPKTAARARPGRISPFLVPMMIVDLAAGHISIRYNLKGINYAPVSACATGIHAIGEAFEVIRRGDADVIVCGGFDAGVTPLGVAGFAQLAHSRRATTTRKARRARGTPAATVSSSPRAAACSCSRTGTTRSRAAPPSAPRSSATARRRTRTTSPPPRPTATARSAPCARRSRRPGLSPPTSTTSTPTAPPRRSATSPRPTRSRRSSAPTHRSVSSTKSMMGHMLGGAGAAEAAVCVLAMENSLIPPTINLTDPDPACDLDYVPNVARRSSSNVRMSNSFGFGGHNATLVFAKAVGPTMPRKRASRRSVRDDESRLDARRADPRPHLHRPRAPARSRSRTPRRSRTARSRASTSASSSSATRSSASSSPRRRSDASRTCARAA